MTPTLSLESLPRPWDLPEDAPAGMTASGYWLGNGNSPLEVASATSTSRPTVTAVRSLWQARKGNTPSPLLLVVAYSASDGDRCAACGAVGSDPVVLLDLDPGQVTRIAATALAEPDRHAAVRFLQATLPEAPQDLPGLRNAGMFATHDLRDGVPSRPDWAAACENGKPLLDKRGKDLIEGLGFTIDQLGTNTSVLTAGGQRRAIAVFLDEAETPEGASTRFDGSTPISQGLAAADAQNLPYVVLTRGPQIRVYATDPNLGVGRKGRAETMIEANLALLPDDAAGYLPLLFGSGALGTAGTFQQVLESSRDFATSLGERLRGRVYEDAVPALSRAVAAHSRGQADEADLQLLYEQALFVLFRLLFIAYAEDKDLLPYRSSGAYQRHALKTIARELADRANDGALDFDDRATNHWVEFEELCRAVDLGNHDLDVPAYNGGLFSSDPDVNAVGAAVDQLTLTNAEFGPALFALLIDRGDDGLYGPVDFRSLSVREFGTIYEGLLESNLSVAPEPLAVDDYGTYLPAGGKDEVVVPAGQIYLHDRSGARRATGSYFTKAFAVEHLLDHALEPVLAEHVGRLESLIAADDEHAAAAAFFDFRCADIAMGSGHFLVAAVDRIEARLSSFLASHPLPGVLDELERLKQAALVALGEVGAGVEIEHASLLRRQVARRCIYGVDRNEIAVELARLGLWIHTFVPGLPLGFLDHNLRVGDSLTGIGSIDEAAAILDPDAAAGGTGSLFGEQMRTWLGEATEALGRLGRASDASAAEIKAARKAEREAREAVAPVRDLLDLLVAIRLGEAQSIEDYAAEAVTNNPDLGTAVSLANDLAALHFPVWFPEVFLRERPGFDCIIGNPPWEEATVEELRFWNSHAPGLKAMSQAKQKTEVARIRKSRPDLVAELEELIEEAEFLREALMAGPFDGMGVGDPDLYKAFTWRFWQLIREGGAIGVVLPRSALSAAGSGPWREAVFDDGQFSDVTLLLNRAGWVFDEVEPRYTVGLVAIRKGADHRGAVILRGPFSSLAQYEGARAEPPARFDASEFRTWLSGAAFPLLPAPASGVVFAKLRAQRRLDDLDAHTWRARPVAELHATNDKGAMVLDPAGRDDLWPVYTGASFDLWVNDTGKYYAWADPGHITEVLQLRRLKAGKSSKSAFSEMPASWREDPETLPARQVRIAFRDVTRGTDTRTLRAALIPPERPLTNKAPYFLWPRGDERDQAFLLGVLCSRPLDWYARRVVEISMNFHILNSFPIPALDRTSALRQNIEQASGRLAATDERYAQWADAVGVDHGPLDADDKQGLVTRLDALVAHAYELDRDDVVHIFETFHEGWDYEPTLLATLADFEALS